MLAKNKLKKKQYYKYLDNVRLKKKKKSIFTSNMITKGKLSSPLFRRENHWSIHCVCCVSAALLSIKLTGFLLTLSVKVGKCVWRRHV